MFPRTIVLAGASSRNRPRNILAQRLLNTAMAFAILTVSTIGMVETFTGFRDIPPACQRVLRYSMRFASINNYGLFRSMTTRRPEIIVEGSKDGKTWPPYEFKWKPGNPARRPGFVAPHQPRLDWQMWFAALGDFQYRRNLWFALFMRRLLEGEEQVLELLGTNPFPEDPPRYVRATLYDYHFTDAPTRKKTGLWWTRTRLRSGAVLAVVSQATKRHLGAS